jgi:capsular exopolysaccharide synthesis family protein
VGLQGYLTVLRVRRAVVAAVTAVCVSFAAVLTFTATPQYLARAGVFLSANVGRTAAQLSRGTDYSRNLARTYAEVATSRVVLDPVIGQTGLHLTADELARKVTARAPLRTVMVEIAVRDSSAERAAAIADAVAVQLSSVIADLTPAGPSPSSPVLARTVTPAAVPSRTVYPRTTLNLTLGLLLGLLGGAVLAVAVDAYAARLTSRLSVAEVTTAPVLGTVSADLRRLPTVRRRRRRLWPTGPTIELWTAFTALRDRRRLRTVVFTSALDDAATSLATSDLATAMARSGAEVLLIDADLHRPGLSGRLELPETTGLSSALTGKGQWSDAVRRVPGTTLWVLPAGPQLPDPGALLGSVRMAELLADLVGRYPLVLLKAPPVLRVAEGLALSRLVDGVVVVADGRWMRRSQLAAEVAALSLVNAELVGVVLVG